MNMNSTQARVSPWVLFAREKMREAQEKMKQEGIEGDLAERERIEEGKWAEAWNRANASRSSQAATTGQVSLEDPQPNDVLSFNIPGHVSSSLQMTTTTVHDMTAFVLEPDLPYVEMDNISLGMGQIPCGTRHLHVEEPWGGLLDIVVPQG